MAAYEDPGTRPVRTVVLPVVPVPSRGAVMAAAALVLAASAAVVSSAILAVTYRIAAPSGSIGSPGFPVSPAPSFPQPRLTAADRVTLLARGTGYATAGILLVGIVCLLLAERDRLARMILWVGVAVATIVIATDAIDAVNVLAKAQGSFLRADIANRGPAVIALVGPAIAALGALYAAARILRAGGHADDGPDG